MRITAWLAMVLVLLAGGEAFAQPVCDAGGPYFGLINKPITLDGTGSSSPGGTIISYTWDFGDGTTGSGPTPEHTYTALFYFTITLTVVDSNQQSSSCETWIYVDYPEGGPPTCDAGGPYYGVVNQPIEFDGSRSSDPDGFIVAYDWDFGDGATGTGTNPAHAYVAAGTYVVSLAVTDDDGASSVCTTTATTVGEPGTPICDAGGPYYGSINEPILFDGTGSSSPQGGTITAYDWDFGDGATGTGATPQHAYAALGSYMVTLVVHDDRGGQSACIAYAAIHALAVEPASWGRIKATYR